jgi:hypothetical protein
MKKNRLEKLEAVRGLAALYVVLFHALPQKIYLLGINIGVFFRFGPEAVIIFFVLCVKQHNIECGKSTYSFQFFKSVFLHNSLCGLVCTVFGMNKFFVGTL